MMRKYGRLFALAALLMPSAALAASSPVVIVGPTGGSVGVSNGALNVNASITPSGTQDVNVKSVGGNTVTKTLPSTATDSTGLYQSNVLPFGEMPVAAEPWNRFQDTFDSGVRDTVNWAAPTAAGGGSVATWSAGTVTIGTGTTANGYSYMTTLPTFKMTQPGYVESGIAIKIPASIPANTYMAWGTFTPTATPTAASPIQEGCAFEIQPGGKEYIACYAGAVRTVIQDMSAGTGNGLQPTDGGTHLFIQYFSGDRMAWTLGSYTSGAKDPITQTVIATQQTGVNGPNVNTQPLTILAVAGASTPASSLIANIASTWVATTNANPWMCDSTYSFRCATVKAASTAAASTDLPIVVALHPSSPLPAGTNNIGNTGILGVNGTTLATLANPASVQLSNGSSAVTYLPAGQALSSASTPVVIASDQSPVATASGVGAGTAITASATGTTAATTATLSGTSGKTTYICGFDIGADATAATVGTATVTGPISGTMSFRQGVGAVATATVHTTQTFTPCIPASATNTAIAVVSIAAGTSGNTTVNAWGFQK